MPLPQATSPPFCQSQPNEPSFMPLSQPDKPKNPSVLLSCAESEACKAGLRVHGDCGLHQPDLCNMGEP
eukprot:scaffold231848_cov12-Tisochrysis_lutea.AAC.1